MNTNKDTWESVGGLVFNDFETDSTALKDNFEKLA
jgi:hypothetical protein